jgi:guanosine-3',5'-bis(diphosphate) 3'-pyrophosphohydrolase
MSQATGLTDRAIAFSAAKFESSPPAGEPGLCCVPNRAELVRILQEEGSEPDPYLMVAAVLGGVLQHTPTAEEEIVKAFGVEVALIVAELTENSKFTIATRKTLRLTRMSGLSRKAKLILIAEIIETLRQIAGKTAPGNWSVQHKLEFFDWADKIIAAMGKVNTTLLAIYLAELEAAKLSVAIKPVSAKKRS